MTFFLKKIEKNDKRIIQRMFVGCDKTLRVLDFRSVQLDPHEEHARIRVGDCDYGRGLYHIHVQHFGYMLLHHDACIGIFTGNLRAYIAQEVDDTSHVELDVDSVFVLPQHRGLRLWSTYTPEIITSLIGPFSEHRADVRVLGQAISAQGANFLQMLQQYVDSSNAATASKASDALTMV